MNKALLDTDIYSEILKGQNPTVTKNAITYRRAQGTLTVTVVTVMEVIRGFQKTLSHRRLNEFLEAVAAEEVITFDQSTAELAGRIGGDLERVGRPIGTADTMIAAIAIEHGLSLVTGNITHFEYVQTLGYPLTLVNWRVIPPA